METTEKKQRKRSKKLCKDIRGQMEFYFSDANLHKDRFLKKKIDESSSGWLDLELFSNFNKLKNLTTDLGLVAKALTTSILLQVSDDGKQVKRKIPLADPKDVEDRTIYVECLPGDANHDWVKTTFSHYGKVVYVSLPKYRSTGDIKGFAFVEFERIEDAKRVCEVMNNPAASLSDSVGKFPTKGCKQIQKLQKQISAQKGKKGHRTRTVSETEVSDMKAEDARREQLKQSGKKRIRLWSQGTDRDSDINLSAKRLKTEESCDKDTTVNTEHKSSSDSESSEEEQLSNVKRLELQQEPEKGELLESKRKRKVDESNDCDDSEKVIPEKKAKISTSLDKEDLDDGDKEEKGEKKKKRKRKKKLKEDKRNIPELRVISKKEWTELRNEYIQLQKSNMAQLKASLKEIKATEEDKIDVTNGKQPASQGEKENDSNQSNGGKSSKGKGSQLEFTPDVIVQVKSTKELIRKELKEQLNNYGDIAYIDVLEGDTLAHVRCPTAEAATNIAKATVEQLEFVVLKGEEEKSYWDKILADREKKFNNKSKTKKRGKDKAIGKVAMMREALSKKTHVFFEDT